MTEQEQIQEIEQARHWVTTPSWTDMPDIGRAYVSSLLQIIEEQKGSCLVAWAENKQLKLELNVLKRANGLQAQILKELRDHAPA